MRVLEITDSYYIEFDSLDSRLDFVHYHPSLDYLNELEKYTDFNVLSLVDVCETEIISGTTPRNLKYDEKNGIDFIGASNIFDTGIEQKKSKKIAKEYLDTSMSNSTAESGDILVTIAGTVGKCGIYNEKEKSFINQNVARFKANKQINGKYLVLYLNSEIGRDIFYKFRHDVGQPYINTEELGQIPIIVPKDIKIQETIINEIYPMIEKSKRLQIGLDASVDDIYDELIEFLGFELNIKDHNLYFNTDNEPTYSYIQNFSELGDRIDFIHNSPKLDIVDIFSHSDNFVSLSDVCTKPLRRGVQPKYNKYGSGLTIKTSSLKNIFIDYDNCSKVDFDFALDNDSIIKKNDIVLSSTGIKSLGKVDIFDSEYKAIADGHISIITLNQEHYDIRFITYFLRSALGQLQIEKYWSGSSGQIELNIKELGKIQIPSYKKYTKDEQSKIANSTEEKIKKYLCAINDSETIKAKAYEVFTQKILNKHKV